MKSLNKQDIIGQRPLGVVRKQGGLEMWDASFGNSCFLVDRSALPSNDFKLQSADQGSSSVESVLTWVPQCPKFDLQTHLSGEYL